MPDPKIDLSAFDKATANEIDLSVFDSVVKKKDSSKGVESTGTKSNSGSKPSLSSPINGNPKTALPFQPTNTSIPTVLVGKAREQAKVKVQQRKEQAAKQPQPKETGGMGASFMKGLTSFNESLAKTPRYIYELAAAPQNFLAEITNTPELRADYDYVTQGKINPLGVLDRLGDFYKNEGDNYESKIEKFDKGVFESFKEGDYRAAGQQVLNNIAQSAPSIAGMMVTGGIGNAAKAGKVATTMLNALPFASSKNAEIQSNTDMPEYVKPLYSALHGFSEVVFDQDFGTKAAIDDVIRSFGQEGREIAVDKAKGFVMGYLENAVKKVQPLTTAVKNSLEEMTTTYSQNLIDKLTIDPDKDLFEGIADAAIIGGVTGGSIKASGMIANGVLNTKNKQKINEAVSRRNDLLNDIDNPNLPEEVKEEFAKELEKTNDKISKLSDDGEAKLSSLPEKEQSEALEIQEKIDILESSLADESISESSKKSISEQVDKLQDDLDELHETASILEKPDSEEEIFKDSKEAERKFEKDGDQVDYEQKMKEIEARATLLQQPNETAVDETVIPVEPQPELNAETPITPTTEAPLQEQPIAATEEAVNSEKITPANEDTNEGVNELTEPPIEPQEPVVPIAPKEENMQRKRAFTQQVLNGNFSPEFKNSITEDQIYYERLPNKVTLAESNAIIDYLGNEQAAKEVANFGNGMKAAIRFTVAQSLIKRFEADGDYENAIDVLETFTKAATDYGQGIQSLSMFPRLSKEGELRAAQKTINKQRDTFKAKHKPRTTKLVKELKKANKETADEVVSNLSAKIQDADKAKPKDTNRPSNYGAKNKLVTRDKYLKAKRELKGKFFTGLPTELVTMAAYHIEANGRDFAKFSRNMVVDLGNKVKPYLRELYNKGKEDLITNSEYQEADFLSEQELNTELAKFDGSEWKDKLESALKRSDKTSKRDAETAIAKLQEISKEEGLWGQYKAQAVSKLKGINIANTQADINANPPLREFTDGLVKNMRAKINESLPETEKAKRPAPRKAIEVLGDAYHNFEKYRDVWENTQAEFTEKYADNPDVLDALDEYFGELLDTPFSNKVLGQSIREGLEDLGITGGSAPKTATKSTKKEGYTTLSNLVTQHYTIVDATKRSLAQKLVDEARLEGLEAKQLATAIEEEFDRIATAKKQQILERIFSKKERKKGEIKTLEKELIKLSNLGAFNDDAIVESYADKMGFPKLTEQNVREIERLSNAIETAPEGAPKRRAVEDLLAYQATIKGQSTLETATAMWYASVLSGHNTQITNFVSGLANSSLLYANVIAQNPKAGVFVAKGFFDGFKRGLLEGTETWLTGYSPIKGKAEVPPLLERIKFKPFTVWGKDLNPANYAKYVRRLMVAADVVIFEAQKEMRAYQLAYKMAKEDAKLDPSIDVRNKAAEIVGKESGNIQLAEEQAQLDYEKALDDIKSQGITGKAKDSALAQAERDRKRRVFDLVEASRGEELLEETSSYASRGTFNFKPEGALGAIAIGINFVLEQVPGARFVVPFTNIIANIANETLNYTPYGFVRSKLQKGGIIKFNRMEITAQDKIDLTTKAIMGTSMMALTYALSQAWSDEDEPYLQITGNGFNDFRKNQELRETGWEPYAFKLKGTDTWISYQYTPLIVPLGLIGHLRDVEAYREDKVGDKEIYTKMAIAAGRTVQSFGDVTFLGSLNGFLETILNPRYSESLAERGVQAVTNVVKGLIVPNAYTQVAQEYEKVFDIPMKDVQGTLFGGILKDIPVARRAYDDRINALGEPISPDTDRFVSFKTDHKIFDLVASKKADIGAPSIKKVVIYDPETGTDRVLTKEEFYTFAKVRGEYIRDILEKNYDLFSKMDEKKFQKRLTSIKTRATKRAKYAVVKMDYVDEGD